MNKFKDDEIDKEFFENDFFTQERETIEDVEKYKTFIRNSYAYALYRWDMTMLPCKTRMIDWVRINTVKVVDFITMIVSKIIKQNFRR